MDSASPLHIRTGNLISHCEYSSHRGKKQGGGQATWSKMAVGMARVAQALGTSTMPDSRPSQGQQDSSRYTCAQHRTAHHGHSKAHTAASGQCTAPAPNLNIASIA